MGVHHRALQHRTRAFRIFGIPWFARHTTLALTTASVFSCGTDAKQTPDNSLPTQLGFREAPERETMRTCVRIAVVLLNRSGDVTTTPERANIQVETSRGSIFGDPSCQSETGVLTIEAGQSSVFSYIKSESPGDAALKATGNLESSGRLEDAFALIRMDSDATRLTFRASEQVALVGACVPIAFRAENGAKEDSALESETSVTFLALHHQSDSSLGLFYTDASCTNQATQFELPAGSSSLSAYFKTAEPGAYKLSATFTSPRDRELIPSGILDLNIRTPVSGTWVSACTATQRTGEALVQHTLNFTDTGFTHTTARYSGASGICIATELDWWTEFKGTYRIPLQLENAEQAAGSEPQESPSSPSDVMAPATFDLNLQFTTSCVGLASAQAAAEFRSRQECGTRQWRESTSACTDTTFYTQPEGPAPELSCSKNLTVPADARAYHRAGFADNEQSALLVSGPDLWAEGQFEDAASRPQEVGPLPYKRQP